MDRSLTPAEALELANRATAAASRPVPPPDWYGPAVGAVFLAQGLVVGAAMQFDLDWLMIVGCSMVGPVIGALAGGVVRLQKVVNRPSPAAAKVAVLTALTIAAVELGLGGLGWWAGLPMLMVGAVAGAAAGAVFWRAMRRVTLQMRGAGPEGDR
ncbi:hypothetical protein ACGFX4_28155 [Kitasatospora sp. NPDC048365]|uniref:hypothetical protein n=1 Tax=Kitasatospora sp. NPDC048365 TaxID=3364050 RepID=UPI0037154F5D